MKIIDISWPLNSQTTGYKNRQTVNIQQRKEFQADGYRETSITIDSHAGTHVDAPSHFLSDGKTIDQLSLASMVGAAKVIDCGALSVINAEFLMNQEINPGDILLFKTTNSQRTFDAPFDPGFVYLDAAGAQYLADCMIRAVGIDYLGIERAQPDHATHTLLMINDITIIEGLRLAKVDQGTYLLVCLPLAVQGLEASPARALLIQV